MASTALTVQDAPTVPAIPLLDIAPKDYYAALMKFLENGDITALPLAAQVRLYAEMCDGLGLPQHIRPFKIVEFNKAKVLYLTAAACDAYAELRGISRSISKPEIIDLEGKKVIYIHTVGQNRAGRREEDHYFRDLTVGVYNSPAQLLLKAQSAAKRRITKLFLSNTPMTNLMTEDDLESLGVDTAQGRIYGAVAAKVEQVDDAIAAGERDDVATDDPEEAGPPPPAAAPARPAGVKPLDKPLVQARTAVFHAFMELGVTQDGFDLWLTAHENDRKVNVISVEYWKKLLENLEAEQGAACDVLLHEMLNVARQVAEWDAMPLDTSVVGLVLRNHYGFTQAPSRSDAWKQMFNTLNSADKINTFAGHYVGLMMGDADSEHAPDDDDINQ